MGESLTQRLLTRFFVSLSAPVSADMRVSGSYGLFVPGPSPGRIAMATVDGQTTLAVELAHSRALQEKRGVAIQVSLLFMLKSLIKQELVTIFSPSRVPGCVVLQHSEWTHEDQGSHSDSAVLTSAPGHVPTLPGANAARVLLQEE